MYYDQLKPIVATSKDVKLLAVNPFVFNGLIPYLKTSTMRALYLNDNLKLIQEGGLYSVNNSDLQPFWFYDYKPEDIGQLMLHDVNGECVMGGYPDHLVKKMTIKESKTTPNEIAQIIADYIYVELTNSTPYINGEISLYDYLKDYFIDSMSKEDVEVVINNELSKKIHEMADVAIDFLNFSDYNQPLWDLKFLNTTSIAIFKYPDWRVAQHIRNQFEKDNEF